MKDVEFLAEDPTKKSRGNPRSEDYNPHTSCARRALFGYTLSCEDCRTFYERRGSKKNI